MLKFKLRRTLRGNIKAVSPVIATIIIVAVAITMSIAVAYWLLGLGGSFTRFEKVEFTTGYAEVGTTPYEFKITLNVKNTGSAVATIAPELILYNGKPLTTYSYDYIQNVATPPTDVMIEIDYATYAVDNTKEYENLVLNPGESDTITINYDLDEAPTNNKWMSGMTLEITLHTTGGKDYPKSIILP